MKEIIINTDYPNYEYSDYDSWINSIRQYGLLGFMNNLIRDLDCTRLLKNGQRIIYTNAYNYNRLVYQYIRCLFYITNPIIYNKYLDILLTTHNNNLEFEEYYKEPMKIDKTKKKPKVKNEFVRAISHDMFTGEIKYLYSNLKTGEEIISNDPNLLEELNKPKRKKKDKVEDLSNWKIPTGVVFKFKK